MNPEETAATTEAAAGFDVQTIIDYLVTRGSDLAIGLVAAIAILFFGRIAARWVSRTLGKTIAKRAEDVTVSKFVESVAYVTLMVVVVLAAIGKLGVQTTSFVAILGAAGLAIGLALQGSLANFASGFLMLIFRPISIGEFVQCAGTEGVVNEIGIFTTTLLTPDNRRIIIGNAAVTGGNIVNFSREPIRRVDMVIGIGYDDDIKKTKEVLTEILKAHPNVLAEPAPAVAVSSLGDNSVNFNVRPWVNSPDYWPTHNQLIETIKLRFDEEGISFPFPQRDVHLYKAD